MTPHEKKVRNGRPCVDGKKPTTGVLRARVPEDLETAFGKFVKERSEAVGRKLTEAEVFRAILAFHLFADKDQASILFIEK